MKRTKIALLGIFGVQNLGNECTLQAVVHNVRERLPGAELYSICYEPEDTYRRHGLSAVPISERHSGDPSSRPRTARRSKFGRLLRVLFVGAPGELLGWLRAIRVLKGTDIVAMTGTGMLTDYNTSAFGFPYDIWKWATAARLAGCKVRFVGIGVGPIYEQLSRRFIRSALAVADYRSYRDELSKARLHNLGFDTAQDPVFPDLAFSLPVSLFEEREEPPRRRTTVGVGVMDYFDRRDAGEHSHEATYQTYLCRMCDFVEWLAGHDYGVRILQGDMRYDGRVRRDLRSKLEQRGTSYEQSGIIDENISSVTDLVGQIATTDVVVSPRFHNLILALMLAKPVIAISYDPKSDALLEGFGLRIYCQPIADLDVRKLVEQVVEVDGRREAIKPLLRQKTAEYRRVLDEQYRLLLDL